MKSWVWVCAAMLGTSMSACGGGDDDACARADDVALLIRTAALVDMIPTEEVCVADVTRLLQEAGYAGGDDTAIVSRAAEYVAQCKKYAALVAVCEG